MAKSRAHPGRWTPKAFVADDGTSVKMFKSDGTSQGTIKIEPLSGQMSDPSYFAAVGTSLYFTADDGVNGYEL